MTFISDWSATFVTLADGQFKDEPSLDSHDLTSMLTHGTSSPRDEIIFEVAGSVRTPAIRNGDYKLIGDELYNIAEAPYETTDIAKQRPRRVKQMRAPSYPDFRNRSAAYRGLDKIPGTKFPGS